ncbi:hypothetical protein BV25DRAFT_1824661 [Artomyces pyxidatus]|uniref:Uncharacterized protein n=1 Tax=Artomyces pyxidatus TaxID=48021 RepID=A0ACB8T2P0_9AGAM|nr:hypothetical protein BV25DRAFT_1824661 [Artomyces pyxidatus]
MSASAPPPHRRIEKVAVVGSGLAGLTAAYLLSHAHKRADVAFEEGPVEFEVHIFEKAESLGMDSHSVSLSLPGRVEEWRVDVPMRSFQGGYYPQLIALYKHLGVSFRHADFSYSFSYLKSLPSSFEFSSSKPSPSAVALNPTIVYNGASGRSGISVPTTLTQCYTSFAPYTLSRAFAKVSFYLTFTLSLIALFYNFLRLQLLATPLLRGPAAHTLSWAEWSEHATPRGVLARMLGLDVRWRAFISDICGPLFSAVCTAAREDVDTHPAEEFLDFVWKTFLTHHYVVSHGVRDVVARLTAELPATQVHLGAPTTKLLPDRTRPGLVSIVCSPTSGAAEQVTTGFSHVIFATQANHAAPLVAAYARALYASAELIPAHHAIKLSTCLAQFEYRQTIVVNHTDASLLPADARDRRDLNLVTALPSACPPPSEKSANETPSLLVPPTYAMTTHMLPRPHAYADAPDAIFQTTNPIVAPRAGSVLSVARLERALLTRAGKAAVGLLSAPEHEDTDAVGVLQGAARREMGGARAAGLWAVGAYAYHGIPLLEGCVAGAREVVERGVIGCEGGKVTGAPW